MFSQSLTFGVSFNNVPLVNLRWEFKAHHQVVHTPGFTRHPDGRVKPIQTRYLLWVGMPGAGVTLLVQRAISGIEAYIRLAVQDEACTRGVFTEKLRSALDNPFTLGKKAADNYYNRLPALVFASLAMKSNLPALWARTELFCAEVRNPVIHGYEFAGSGCEAGVARVFDHIGDMYRWIDGWHDPEQAYPGLGGSFKL